MEIVVDRLDLAQRRIAKLVNFTTEVAVKVAASSHLVDHGERSPKVGELVR